jgi:hypothetical protein
VADRDAVLRNAQRYFDALDRFDLDEVAACFTEDAFYSHPPYVIHDGALRQHGHLSDVPERESQERGDAYRAEAQGRAGIIALLRDERGNRPVIGHEIRQCVVDGDVCYLEMAGLDPAGNLLGIGVSSARVTADGLFSSYVAYHSVPAPGTSLARRRAGDGVRSPAA